MSSAKECCTRPPVASNYSPKGSIVKVGDMNVYETADKSSKRVLILVYDIFAMTPQPKQFADHVGNCGYRVVIPDFFRGKAYDATNFPPKDFSVVAKWCQENGPWDKVKPDLVSIIQNYKKQGATAFGIFGFCWGGKISTLASIHLSADIKVAGLIHPYLVELKEASEVKTPILLVPSKDEEDMVPFAKVVKQRLGEKACEHVRMNDMFHGYACARGDFANELNRKRVEETIALLIKFFDQHIPK